MKDLYTRATLEVESGGYILSDNLIRKHVKELEEKLDCGTGKRGVGINCCPDRLVFRIKEAIKKFRF